MTICRCTSFGCGVAGNGVEVDPRTFKNHSLRDRVALAQKVQEESETVINEQLDKIALQLAATTLSGDSPDDITQSEGTSGGRLWSRTRRNCPSTADEPISSASTSRQQTIRGLLTRLSDIECSADALDAKVTSSTSGLASSPAVRASSFPLRGLQAECLRLQTDLSKVSLNVASVSVMKESVGKRLDKISEKLEASKATWTSVQESLAVPEPSPGIRYPTEHFYKPLLPRADPILQVVMFLIMGCNVILGTSRRGCSFILGMVQYAIQLTLMRSLPTDASLPPRDRKLLADFPLDPRPVEKEFDLDPETVIYAVCPDAACRATYGPRFEGDSAIPIYPSRCRCRKNGRRCRQQLLRPKIIQDHVVYTPIEPFVYFSPTHWLGRFLSRPGVEAGMDGTWNRDKGPSKENPGFMYDIFDAEMLRDFKGIDGKHFSKGNGEGRISKNPR